MIIQSAIIKKKLSLIIILFLVFTSKVLSIESKIVVNVDNKIITNLDINNEANYLEVLNPNLKNLNENKIFNIAKLSLIREKIKEIELSKFNQKEIQDDYLENVVRSIYKNIGLKNKDEFLNYIESAGINITTIEEKLRQEALWNQLIFKKYFNKLKIDKAKIQKDILNNKIKTSSYLLYEIVYNATEKDESKKLFEEIKQSIIKNGFENSASIYSISESSKTGGKIGWINENSVSKKILQKISNLKIGEHTNPILIPGGFLILSVKDKKKIEKKINIKEELALRIRSIQNQQLNQYSTIYYNKIKRDIIINEK